MSTPSQWANRTPPTAPKPTRQWQGAPGHGDANQAVGSSRKKFWLWLTASVLLLCGLIALLPYSPEKTPCFVWIESDYRDPFPFNPWGENDAELLGQLDGQVLAVHRLHRQRDSTNSLLADLTRQVTQQADAIERRGCCIFYISVHGLVDDSGRPCLVPASGDPHDAGTWVAVEDVLEVFQTTLSPDVEKLLVFDCVRVHTQWDLGLFYNDFVAALAPLVEDAPGKLSLITSSAPGEIAWPRSNFALQLARGLAGASATGRLTPSRITAAQVHAFVQPRVRRWALANRDQSQTPLYFATTGSDNSISIPVNQQLRRILDGEQGSVLDKEPAVSLSEMIGFWETLDRLRSTAMARLDPLRFGRLQRQLVRIDQLRRSGAAVDSKLTQQIADLREELRDLAQNDWTSLSQQWAGMKLDQPHLVPTFVAHTVTDAEAIGVIDRAEAQRVAGSIDETLRRWTPDQFPLEWRSEIDRFQETQFLRIGAAADVIGQWGSKQPVIDAKNLRQSMLKLAGNWVEGTFSDLRTQEQIRPRLVESWNELRNLEDMLWYGNFDDFKSLTTSMKGRLQGDFEAMAVLTQVHKLADAVSLQLPHLGQWLGDTWLQEIADDIALDLPKSRETFARLVEQTRRLNRLLSKTPIDDSSLSELKDLSDAVRESQDTLLNSIQQYGDTLVASGEKSARCWREISAMLSMPLLSVDLRRRLSERHLEISGVLRNEEGTEEITEEGTEETNEEGTEEGMKEASTEPVPLDRPSVDNANQTWREMILRSLKWSPRVAGLVASGEAKALDADFLSNLETPSKTLVKIQREFRLSLRQLGQLASLEKESDAQDAVLAAAGKRLSREHRLRLASGLWFTTKDEHYITRQHLRRVKQFFLWRAEQAIGDSWGGTSLADNQTDQVRPFFVTMATDLLDAADAVRFPKSPLDQKTKDVRAKLMRHHLTLTGGIKADASNSSDLPGLGRVEIDMRLQPRLPEVTLSRGSASVFVRSSDGNRVNVLPADESSTRLQTDPAGVVLFPISNDGLSRRYVLPRQPETQGLATLVTFFRGNEIGAAVTINGGNGVEYQFEPQTFDRASVTLRGTSRQRPSIVFVLDCSDSMSDLVLAESATGDIRSKLDVAKSTLTGMLDELAVQGDARVGVIAFGHRVGWSRAAPTRLLTQPTYDGPLPESLSASNDVETILTLGRFDATEAAKLSDRLRSVRPWGQSPLYLSLLRAVDAFSVDDEETNKSIVVVTDGLNYQFTPARQVVGADATTSLSRVIDAAARRSVPIHILGFAVDGDESRRAQAAFDQIAQASDGSYQEVTSGRELLAEIQNRLRWGTFRVQVNSDQRPATVLDQGKPLNAKVQVATRPGRQTNATVTFRDAEADVVLYGGQSLELAATKQAGIRSIPYDVDSPISVPLVVSESLQDTGHTFRLHRPVRGTDDLTLRVSIQSDDEVSTRRPAEVWLEVSPVDSNDPVHHFFDAHFQPQQPVPVLQWTLGQWDPKVRKARVRFWCKPKTTDPIARINLKDVLRQPDRFAAGQSLAAAPGIRYRMNLQQNADDQTTLLTILLLHPSDQPSGSPVKVQVTGAVGLVRQVERYIDVDNAVARHSFLLSNALLADPDLQPVTIDFTPMAETLRQSWGLQGESIEVNLIDDDGFIPIELSVTNENR